MTHILRPLLCLVVTIPSAVLHVYYIYTFFGSLPSVLRIEYSMNKNISKLSAFDKLKVTLSNIRITFLHKKKKDFQNSIFPITIQNNIQNTYEVIHSNL